MHNSLIQACYSAIFKSSQVKGFVIMGVLIVRRSGEVEPFASGRIALAVFRASQSIKMPANEGRRLSGLVAQTVQTSLMETNRSRVELEEIQDLVVTEIRFRGFQELALVYESYRVSRTSERKKNSLNKKIEKSFRFLLSNGKHLEVGRSEWATVLGEALRLGVGDDWSVSEWWSSCKEVASEKKNFDDFIDVHVQALLDKAGDREHWLHSASVLILERWYIRVCGDSPFISGQEVALKAMKLHCKSYWAARKVEQKSDWFPSVKDLDFLIKRFKSDFQIRRGLSGLLFLEKMFGHGAGALLPQEIFLNTAVSLCFSGASKSLHDEILQRGVGFLDRCIDGDFIPPYALMRQSLAPIPCLVQEASYPMPDTLEGIFEVLGKTAVAAKSGVSVSVDLSGLRAEGEPVGADGKVSGGIEPVLRLFGEACSMVKNSVGDQQKARISLSCWHADLEEYLGYCRIAPKQVRLSVSLPDAFMKKVMEGGDWILASPTIATHLTKKNGADFEHWIREYIQMAKFSDVSGGRCLPAREVFRWITECASVSDNPSIIFGDACLAYSTGQVGGQLSARMSTISKVEQACEIIELGVVLKDGEHDQNLCKLAEAHQFLASVGIVSNAGTLIIRNVAPVGAVDLKDFVELNKELMKKLEKLPVGSVYVKGSFFAQNNPWEARRLALESSRGGYLEADDLADLRQDTGLAFGVKKGPVNLLSFSSREEYLWLSHTNPLYVERRVARRQVIFNNVKYGFGGTGVVRESVKSQLKFVAAWQSVSDGPLAWDARLENITPDSVGEAIKLAWLHGMVGVRRFIGQR